LIANTISDVEDRHRCSVASAAPSLFAVACIQPNQPVTAAQLDQVREQLLQRCRTDFDYAQLRMEFIFTARRPFSKTSAPNLGEKTPMV
jgi:hypothetical protein